jgi:asparagine synthase (glutamine-hydrolysing)
MCGIAGIIKLDRIPVGMEMRSCLEKSLDLLAHRGPDDSGIVLEEFVALGHRRLSIIDLAGGHQPMRSACGRGLICYNGEVYNFQELRYELQGLGRTFNTNSDTEVILNSYLEWGDTCLERFRGMFAFCAVDFDKQTSIIARDRLGIKPLVFFNDGNSLVFASELEPLYKAFGPFKLSMEALDDYLQWQYIQAPKTIYCDVFKLEPGHYLSVDLKPGKIQKHEYWDVHFEEDKSLSLEDWEVKIEELIKESVALRLVSDVPFGAFLSGGIDSSLVTGYMSEIMEQPVKTFSIGFQHADFSELDYAKQVAELNETNHKTEIVEADSLALLPTLVRHYGEPFADSSAIPTYYVAKMARQHVKMVLSGDGGDENFAGYYSYESVLRNLTNYKRPALPLTVPRVKTFIKSLLFKLDRANLQLKSGKYATDAYRHHCNTSRHFPFNERKAIFRNEYSHYAREWTPERIKFFDDEKAPILSKLQKLDLKAYLPFDILTKVDIASMANSLEVRVPLLDHKLVEAAAAVPEKFKLIAKVSADEYEKKFLLKLLAKKRYPDNIIDRRKMGFGVPVNRWFANELKKTVRKRLEADNPVHSVLDRAKCLEYADMHSNNYDCSTKLWNLLFLHEWAVQHQEAFD